MNEEHSRRGWRRYLAVKTSLLRNGLSIPMDAQTLAGFLKLNPHMAAESKDNAKCKAFLGELGMLERRKLNQSLIASPANAVLFEPPVAWT